MIRPVNLLLAIAFVGLSLPSFAQGDTHLSDGPAKQLFHRSAWAHGYMHGYELGFHSGNLDLHMARRGRDPHSIKAFKHASHVYRNEFGNRAEFEKGYGSGFEVGYADGVTGKEFRAASEVSLISADLAGLSEADANRSPSFDIMLDSGYMTGRKMGLNDARAKAEFKDASSQTCPESVKSSPFCGAFQIGYRWGYTDGYSNQRPETNTQRASK